MTAYTPQGFAWTPKTDRQCILALLEDSTDTTVLSVTFESSKFDALRCADAALNAFSSLESLKDGVGR